MTKEVKGWGFIPLFSSFQGLRMFLNPSPLNQHLEKQIQGGSPQKNHKTMDYFRSSKSCSFACSTAFSFTKSCKTHAPDRGALPVHMSSGWHRCSTLSIHQDHKINTGSHQCREVRVYMVLLATGSRQPELQFYTLSW